MQGEINEADIQRAESNEVVGRERGKGMEGGREGIDGEGEAGSRHTPSSCVLPPEF